MIFMLQAIFNMKKSFSSKIGVFNSKLAEVVILNALKMINAYIILRHLPFKSVNIFNLILNISYETILVT